MIILDGGSWSIEQKYIGQIRELRADTSNKDLLLHDGVTPGGMRFYNAIRSDARYQARSPELDGLAAFKPEARGFVIRFGAANYGVRQFGSSTAEITITNPDGLDGNIDLKLPQRLPGDRVIGGDAAVEGDLEVNGQSKADGGFFGPLTGDTHGTHTGTVTGNVTGDVVGALDARGKTVQVDDSAFAISKISGLQDALNATGLPIGMIMMWAGAIGSIPAKWHLCDGTGGTPNLVGNFIVAANTSTQNSSGGSSTHTHTLSIDPAGAHLHNVDVGNHTLVISEMPSHAHGAGSSFSTTQPFVYTGAKSGPSLGNSNMDYHTNGSGAYQPTTETIGGDQPHSHPGSSQSAGNHTHTAAIAAQTAIPPYYALAFIMKVSL